MAQGLNVTAEEREQLWKEHCEAVEKLKQTCREFLDGNGSVSAVRQDAVRADATWDEWYKSVPPDDLPF